MTDNKSQSNVEFDYKKLLLKLNGKFSTFFNKENKNVPDVNNPFVYKWNIAWYQWVKIIIGSFTILPFRVVGFIMSISIAYVLSYIALIGRTNVQSPMMGWRKNIILPIFCVFARLCFFFGSVHWIRVKGVRCSSKEAPILVMAPHSSFMDSVFVVYLGMNSVIGKTETATSAVGYLLRMTQPILVTREDPNSRQNTIDDIKKRCISSEGWPQMLIYPEGTCTDRSCLINFKTGAFIPGCPIQPVVLKWPNKMDCITWTWEGPGAWTLLWMLFSQIHTFAELEFLPVYYPNEEEKVNPKLFAENVRTIMAKKLNIPITNHSYEDCRHMYLARKHGLPFSEMIVEFSRLQDRLLVLHQDAITMLTYLSNALQTFPNGLVSIKELCHNISMSDNIGLVKRVFQFYDKNNSGVMDMRELLCHLALYSLPFDRKLALQYITKAYNLTEKLNPTIVFVILSKAFLLTASECNEILEYTNAHPISTHHSCLNSLDNIMNIVGGQFNMYTEYYAEYHQSTRSGSSFHSNITKKDK